jgi:hypothetical protein
LVLVTIPEEMPVNETIDLAKRFADDTDIRPQALILNQFQPEMVPKDRVDDFKALVGAGANKFLAAHPEGEPLLEAGEMYLEARDRATHLGDLVRRSLKLPAVTLPYIFERRHGLAFTKEMARIMSAAQ